MLAVPFSRSLRWRSNEMNSSPTSAVDQHVPERAEHAVAVVGREGDRVLVEHAHEARLAALVGAVRPALLVGRGEEEHVHALDERAVVVVDDVAQGHALEPVGEAPRVEGVLQAPAAVVVEAAMFAVRRTRKARLVSPGHAQSIGS